MPNWCSTDFRFHGNKEQIETLHSKITEWTSSSTMKTDFGDPWLGNILIGAGFKDRIDNGDSSKNVRCRGTVTEIGDITSSNNDDYCFDVYTETAWVPMGKMWELVIKALNLTSVGFSFMAEEGGCDIYWKYDPHNYRDFLYEEIYIDAYGDDDIEDIGGYSTKEEAIAILNEFFKSTFNKLEDFYPLCEEYEEDHEDSFISIHEFEKCDKLYD